MKFVISESEQIRAILLGGNIGYVGWTAQNLGISSKEGMNIEYDALFSISEEDVYCFVKLHGWNTFYNDYPELSKLVDVVEVLPDPTTKFSKWLMISNSNTPFYLAQFNDFDRALWNEWEFADEEQRDRFIIKSQFILLRRLFRVSSQFNSNNKCAQLSSTKVVIYSCIFLLLILLFTWVNLIFFGVNDC